ncbi:beta-1,3-galactosyl-O-glycosyl-glycoprotein beta-1,6-N-acetylglucosaminyltransferase-like [Mytilus edulis]|uniref:beta-1,3-galactosyl-O-glycosyl-glycoprotein beta-1,6-N-acetylglucosaminyltransferase-like n=1 Tax=Mytilus edulis TaxID=6550 RepID=UPI0039F117DB
MRSRKFALAELLLRHTISTKYASFVLLCFILTTFVVRWETLVTRIQIYNSKDPERTIEIYERQKQYLSNQTKISYEISEISSNKVTEKNKYADAKLKFKEKQNITEKYQAKYYQAAPWERIYAKKESGDEPENYILSKKRFVKSVNCAKIIRGSTSEITKSADLGNDYLTVLSPSYYIRKTENCDAFINGREYITDSLSKEEKEFPLAYSILVYKSVYQFERLLRSIYRPQNFYCIHADMKMSEDDYDAVRYIISCFDNVFFSSKAYNVAWGTFSVLAADLTCMTNLLMYKWKYFINLTGQEFPLKTNREIVKILKSFNGANDVHIETKLNWEQRWEKAGPVPDKITPYKGSVHVAVNRNFAQFVIRNETSLRLMNWLKRTDIPDEIFFTTLNHNPHLRIPGSFTGDLKKKNNFKNGDVARYKKWHTTGCTGQEHHGICIASVKDLQVLERRPEMFVNKIIWDNDHYTMDCLEELIYNRTVDGYNENTQFDTKEYSNLYFVRNALRHAK